MSNTRDQCSYTLARYHQCCYVVHVPRHYCWKSTCTNRRVSDIALLLCSTDTVNSYDELSIDIIITIGYPRRSVKVTQLPKKEYSIWITPDSLDFIHFATRELLA